MCKLKNQIAPDHLAQIFNNTNFVFSHNQIKSTHNLFQYQDHILGLVKAASITEGWFSGIVLVLNKENDDHDDMSSVSLIAAAPKLRQICNRHCLFS